jgi:hypothetical protein
VLVDGRPNCRMGGLNMDGRWVDYGCRQAMVARSECEVVHESPMLLSVDARVAVLSKCVHRENLQTGF